MYTPPELSKVQVYFGSAGDVKNLHKGENFSTRLEDEIRIHQGQIQAENLLLNTVAKFQHIADSHGIPREELHQILRASHYNLDASQKAMMEKYHIPEEEFSKPIDFEPIDTADMMRQRAAMMGTVMSSTPVLLRDPWGGKKVAPNYGFKDFKAEVDGIGFSAIASPRYKNIPFRYAVMKYEHDGFADNNPAMMMSDEFCDAFEQYNKDKFGGAPTEKNPLIVSMATNLKPNIHDRFHNWLLYDVNAASDVFKQWGDDIYFVEHMDKNPLLINYEQVATCFHLYAWQTLFAKNPDLKERMYERLEHCMGEIKQFGDYMRAQGNPKAGVIEESTAYAVLSNICFVLNPFEDRFQKILATYPDVKTKLLEVRNDGKGIGATLERLHGYQDSIPSQKYGGAQEAVIEYILRYPLVDEIRAKLKAERSQGRPDDWQVVDGKRIYTIDLDAYKKLPPKVQAQMGSVRDSSILPKLNAALDELPEGMRQQVIDRIEVSEEGYFFLRVDRSELDYNQFEKRPQQKKVLLIKIPVGQEIEFTNEKKLSIKDKVIKQTFHLKGGKDLLAINARDSIAANEIWTYATTEHGIDPQRAIDKASDLAAVTGDKSVGDVYKIEKDVAVPLYGFTKTGFYEKQLEKYLAKAPGPLIMQLHSGGYQRLVKGAFVYMPLGKDPAHDPNPDCHFIENTEYRRDYNAPDGTDVLTPVKLRTNLPLMQHENAQEHLDTFLGKLHQINFQITHGAQKAEALAGQGGGVFS